MSALIRKLPYHQMPSVFTKGSKAWHGICSVPHCERSATWAVLFHIALEGVTVNRWQARCPRHGDSL
jgi:hypothetical protein